MLPASDATFIAVHSVVKIAEYKKIPQQNLQPLNSNSILGALPQLYKRGVFFSCPPSQVHLNSENFRSE